MKRWLPAFLLVVLACLPIVLGHARDATLLEDMDTRVALEAIRARDNPLSWFAGDWPLENHFYRPVSTLTFELDLAIHGRDAAGFGLTNALLAAASILLLFWFVFEWLGRPWMAAAAALLFTAWHDGTAADVPSWLGPLGVGIASAGLLHRLALRERFRPEILVPPILAALLWLAAVDEVGGQSPLDYRMLGWIPGRTASTMTVFALVSLAAAARYLRLARAPISEAPRTTRLDTDRAKALARAASPYDIPATRGTALRAPTRRPWIWAAVALVALALALGSYEQAVMLPAMLSVLVLLTRRDRSSWILLAGAWVVLGGYLVVRTTAVPSAPSSYQHQQFRFGESAWMALTHYLLPSWSALWGAWQSWAAVGVDAWMIGTIQRGLVALATNIGVVVAAWRDRDGKGLLGAWALSTLAFLPMAFLKPFDHYHYLPMAMRAAFAVLLVQLTLRWIVIAVARPALQAPSRPRPEYGSPLRP